MSKMHECVDPQRRKNANESCRVLSEEDKHLKYARKTFLRSFPGDKIDESMRRTFAPIEILLSKS